MRDYGKVQSTFWTSQDTCGLSDTGRMLALYLLTSPHTNLLGCFHLPIGYVSEDLKWGSERVEKGFVELEEKGFATRDKGSKWVVMHTYLKWNPIENPNQGIAAGRLFEQIPSASTVKPLLAKALRSFSKHFPVAILDNFQRLYEPLPKLFLNQEQEQEQEQKQEQEQEQDNTLVEQEPLDPIRTIFEYWQKVMASPKSVLDDKRRKVITRALKSYSPADVCKAIRGCSKTPHNMGVNDSKTKYNALGLILRDADHIDRFIRNDAGQARASVVKETIEETNARVMADLLGTAVQADPNTVEMAT